MSPEEVLRKQLASAMCDLSTSLNNASRAALCIAQLLEDSEGNLKQRRVKTSLREDAIDDLLKKEGYSW